MGLSFWADATVKTSERVIRGAIDSNGKRVTVKCCHQAADDYEEQEIEMVASDKFVRGEFDRTGCISVTITDMEKALG